MTLSEVDAFFQKHPLHDSYFKALNDERAGTLAVAERDVLAAVNHCEITTDQERSFLNAAIAEQTIFLLLNPEYLTGIYSHTQSLGSAGESRRFSSSASPLGQRAAALIAPLLAKAEKAEKAEKVPAVTPDPGTSPGDDDDDDSGDEQEDILPPIIHLNRG